MSNWRTKKEEIIASAQKDPFQTIENLAKRVGTTSPYVRTTLSEKNISLMKLRKEYALKMENIKLGKVDRLLWKYLMKVPFLEETGIKTLEKLFFNKVDDLKKLSGDINEDYFNKSYLLVQKDKPWCLSTLLMHKKIDLADVLTGQELLKQMIKVIKTDNLNISNIEVDIEFANSQIADILEIKPLTPVFCVKQTLKKANQIIALQLVYFDAHKIKLSLSYEDGLIIGEK